MTPTIAVAPPSTSEAPGRTPTAPAGCSEAVLVACVLAEHYNTLSGLVGDTCLLRARHCVDRYLTVETRHGDVLRWQQRVPKEQWAIRWDCAARLTAACYPQLGALPDFYSVDFMMLAAAVAA